MAIDGTDPYTAKYMAGGAHVLARDTARSRTLLAVLALVTLLNAGGAAATFLGALPKASVGVGVVLTVVTALFALLSLTLTVVRSVVTSGEVHVQYGLWGPRVPISRVLGCRVTPYDWTKFGGWGIRRARDGTWAYVMASGDVVELRYLEDGVERTVVFSASDPHAIASAVERARVAAKHLRAPAEPAVVTDADVTGEETQETRERRRI